MYYKGEKVEATGSPNTDFHGYGKAIRKELRKMIPSRKRIRVLDVGTGMGQNTAFLLRQLSGDSEIWTVDPSEEILVNAKASLGRKASKIRFVQASADKLGFADGFFDAVVSVMVMHHVEDALAVLKELARVLKTGGRLLIVDYEPEASQELEFQTRHKEKDFFEPEIIRTAAKKLGLHVKVEEFGLWYIVDARK